MKTLQTYSKQLMTDEQWLLHHASGTLRKNHRLGMLSRDQFCEERIAWEFGYAFENAPESRILTGAARTESDCREITEFGWLCDRYIAHHPDDEFGVGYLQVSDMDGTREGLAIWVLKTFEASWIPTGHLVFALISEYRAGMYQLCRYI